MSKGRWVWVLGCVVAAGCAAATPVDHGMAASATAGSGAVQDQPLLPFPAASVKTALDGRFARLPAPPWAAGELATTDAPAELIRAWRKADNRGWCAPMVPELVHGAPARVVTVDGGWAIAFDAPGKPGMMPNGKACAHCGVGAFGIAGTSVTVDDWKELGPSHLEPNYRDGSLADFEHGGPDDGSVLTATIAPSGQGCVYQVWTFLGKDHLRDLVGGLRFVAVGEHHHGPRMARVP